MTLAAFRRRPKATTAAELLDRVIRLVPPRPALAPLGAGPEQSLPAPVFLSTRSAPQSRPAPTPLFARPVASQPRAAELAYETRDWAPAERGRLTAALYEGYTLQTLRIA